MMSNVSKGTAFEDRVYQSLKQELESGQLCVSPKAAKIFRKKGYYSKDRDKDINTEISVEVTLPSKERPSLIWIFECKDYRGSIPVNDVEEFHAKLQQIGEDNTKGTIVISGALQGGALNYARAKGIGVIRLLPDDQIEHILEFLTMESLTRRRIDSNEVIRALLNPHHRSRNGFFGCSGDFVYGDWFSLLENELKPYATTTT